jgi:hypothetical protein
MIFTVTAHNPLCSGAIQTIFALILDFAAPVKPGTDPEFFIGNPKK